LPAKDTPAVFSKFEGEVSGAYPSLKRCPLNHQNATALRELFDFTRPVLLGLQNSYGLGDRLGLANPGQRDLHFLRLIPALMW
jgi:hypothetical protein